MSPVADVARFPTDQNDPDGATAETVRVMSEQINRAANDPVLKLAARDAVRRFRGGPLFALAGVNAWNSPQAIAESVWFWVKHCLKFVHHDGLIQVWFNERDQLQLLISPDLLLRMSKPRGDCAIYSMLECAMLKALGVSFELVTAAVNPGEPDIFSHVYARAVFPNGKREPLDASHGQYPGWEVPKEHTLRKQVWDEAGNPIPDAQPRFQGLHAYQARPNKPILPKRLMLVSNAGLSGYRRGMHGYRRGLGDDSVTVLDPGVDTSNIPITNPGVYPGLTPTPPPSGGINWNSLLPGLLNSWTTIAGRVIAPTTQITGPGGTSITTPAGSPLPNTALLPGTLTGSGTLLAVGAAVLVLVLFRVMPKK